MTLANKHGTIFHLFIYVLRPNNSQSYICDEKCETLYHSSINANEFDLRHKETENAIDMERELLREIEFLQHSDTH